jgi:hypothetical protein
LTVAEHCEVWFTCTVVGEQVALTDMIVGEGDAVIVTGVVADFVESCLLVAFTVADAGEEGAV